MRLTLIILSLSGLAACERFTEKTSPCFGKNGEPVVSRNTGTPLSLSTKSMPSPKDCIFEPVNGN